MNDSLDSPLHTFHVHIHGPGRKPIESSFDDVARRLAALPKLYFEGDGSFVWARDGGRQQVYGMVYDARDRIQYCEIRGTCTHRSWRLLCQAIGGPQIDELEILVLPEGGLKDLHDFEQSGWPSTGQNAPVS